MRKPKFNVYINNKIVTDDSNRVIVTGLAEAIYDIWVYDESSPRCQNPDQIIIPSSYLELDLSYDSVDCYAGDNGVITIDSFINFIS